MGCVSSTSNGESPIKPIIYAVNNKADMTTNNKPIQNEEFAVGSLEKKHDPPVKTLRPILVHSISDTSPSKSFPSLWFLFDNQSMPYFVR